MSTRTVTILSDFPKDNIPSKAEGFVLILGHEYDADATPDKGGNRPQPVPTALFGGGKPSTPLHPDDDAAFRRVHAVLDALVRETYDPEVGADA